MFSSKRSFLAWAVASSAIVLPPVSAQCNPLIATCPPIPGLPKNGYAVDFTRQLTLPEGWILANSASVKYGSMGAEFAYTKRYEAPYIWTNFYILFGRVELVMQAALGTGIVSSAVLMSDDQDEIDWEWSGNNFAARSGRVQTNYFGKGITGNYDRGTQPGVNSPQMEFHTYTLDWSPTALTWAIDGQTIRTLKAADCDNGAHQYPQSPSRLHLGVWNAGDPASNPATANWAGGYNDITKGPFTAYVKSVEISPMKPCSEYEYGDKSGKWQSIKCTNTTVTLTSSLSSTSSSSLASSSMSSTSSIASNSSSSTSSSSKSSITTSISPSLSSSSKSSSTLSPNGGSYTSSSASPIVKGPSSGSTTPTTSADKSLEPTSSTEDSSAPTVTTSQPTSPIPSSTKPSTASTVSQEMPSYTPKPLSPTASTTKPSTSLPPSPSASTSPPPPSSSAASASTSSKPKITPSSPSSSKPPPIRSTGTICHLDNCLRNLQDPRYSNSATALCKPITSPTRTTSVTVATAIPTWLAGCSGNAARVASACGCLRVGGVGGSATAVGSSTAVGSGGGVVTTASATAMARAAHTSKPTCDSGNDNTDDGEDDGSGDDENKDDGSDGGSGDGSYGSKNKTLHTRHANAHAHPRGWLQRRRTAWLGW